LTDYPLRRSLRHREKSVREKEAAAFLGVSVFSTQKLEG
jgi:hypothetical protein